MERFFETENWIIDLKSVFKIIRRDSYHRTTLYFENGSDTELDISKNREYEIISNWKKVREND